MTSRDPMRCGIIGCGDISPHYLTHSRAFHQFDIVACADLDTARAEARAVEFGIAEAMSVEALLERDDIPLVLNLTPPAAHASVPTAPSPRASTSTAKSRWRRRSRTAGRLSRRPRARG